MALEIPFNQKVQDHLQVAEILWVGLSEKFSVPQIMDIFVPLVGAFHHPLLMRLVCSLGVINALNSIMKWIYSEYRPYWWIRDFPDAHNISYLRQHYLTCETTPGFPSSHAMSFTTFVQIISVFLFSVCFRRFNINFKHLDPICIAVVTIASICMWISRIYLTCQFLHQCVVGSLGAVFLLHLFDLYSTFLYSLSRKVSVLSVVGLGFLAITVFFVKLLLDIDPHWSVRMAFKWCTDPSYLRHEASPIFTLGRDLGFLMGVALSAPLYKRRNECHSMSMKRMPVILVLELVNWYARFVRPKQSGRFVFVAYEFFRNTFHAYTLLSIIPKIS